MLLAFYAFVLLKPYFFWGYPKEINIIFSSIILFIGILLVRTFVFSKNNIVLVLITIILIAYFKASSAYYIFYSLIEFIPLFLFILMKNSEKKIVFRYFIIIFAISLIPGILIYFLNLIHIPVSWVPLQPLNPIKTSLGMFYEKYLGSVVLINPNSSDSALNYRLCAMFDEPGVVGTVSVLILVGEKFKLHKNVFNIIIFIGGILSFSLFFYIIMIGYYLASNVIKKDKKALFFSVVILCIFCLFYSGALKNEFVDKFIISRVSIVNGELSGDNRNTPYFEYVFKNFINSGDIRVLFGEGRAASNLNSKIAASASWQRFVYDNGFFGLLLLILYLLTIFKFYIEDKNGYFVLFAMLLCVYQRPDIFDFSFLVIYFGSLITVHEEKLESLQIQQTIISNNT